MAPLSTVEAAELPDSTYSENRLPRSFFWRGGKDSPLHPARRAPTPTLVRLSAPSGKRVMTEGESQSHLGTAPRPATPQSRSVAARSPAPAAPVLRP